MREQLRGKDSGAVSVFFGNLPVNCGLSFGENNIGNIFWRRPLKMPVMLNPEKRNSARI